MVGIVGLVGVLVGEQGYFGQVVGQVGVVFARGRLVFAELVDGFQQFLHVVLLAQALGRAVQQRVGQGAGGLDDALRHVVGVERARLCGQGVDEVAELRQLRRCACVDGEVVLQRVGQHVPGRCAVRVGAVQQLAHRGVADAACRVVDDAFERLFVVRVGYQAEVGHHVLDFLALVERQPAVYLVGQSLLAECFFQHARL